MAGTKEGGVKAAQTNKTKFGKDFYVEIGRKGGKISKTGGFYANRELAREAGRKGGKLGKRGPSKPKEDDFGFLRQIDDEPILESVELQRSWKDRLLRRIG